MKERDKYERGRAGEGEERQRETGIKGRKTNRKAEAETERCREGGRGKNAQRKIKRE